MRWLRLGDGSEAKVENGKIHRLSTGWSGVRQEQNCTARTMSVGLE